MARISNFLIIVPILSINGKDGGKTKPVSAADEQKEEPRRMNSAWEGKTLWHGLLNLEELWCREHGVQKVLEIDNADMWSPRTVAANGALNDVEPKPEHTSIRDFICE